jgi:hypothetical protein
MQPHQLRAPVEDGEILAQPPLSLGAKLLTTNRAHLAAWDYDFQGRRASELRSMCRKEAVDRSANYLRSIGITDSAKGGPGAPLLVTGHQPELFHPGVWVKNFALGSVAQATDAAGLNLIIDDDIPKAASVRIPHRDAQVGLRTVPVEFDEWTLETPYEDWYVRDERRFANFPDRALEMIGDLVKDPVMREFGPLLREASRVSNRLGVRFAAARRALESRWGLHNREVPFSAVCESDGFLWFVSHLLAYLARFQGVHNAALARYRALYGIRSKNHPVPALVRQADWLEAPFWVWRADQPRRRPLLARQLAKTMQLRIAGEDDLLAEIPLSPEREACCAVEQLRDLPAKRIRLRTRALTTTMFARLLLGDLFIHGIGGAKYDELGDEIVREFFHFEPPSFITLSLTAWLGLPLDPANPESLRQADHDLRDLNFNPDRHLAPELSDSVHQWVERKREAIAAPVETRAQRVWRFHEIRRANEALQAAVSRERERVLSARAAVQAGVRRNHVAKSREYPFVVHSSDRLRATLVQAADVASTM